MIPELRRLAILANVGSPFAALEVKEVQTAAQALGLEVVTFEIGGIQDMLWTAPPPGT